MQHHIDTSDLERLSIQNLINAYCIELKRFNIIRFNDQTSLHKQYSDGKDILSLQLAPLQTVIMLPLNFASVLGHHQIEGSIYVVKDNEVIKINTLMLVNLILQDILYHHDRPQSLNIHDVLARWLNSYEKLQLILKNRQQDIDCLFQKPTLDFVATEQALIYGHAMHPAPKARIGFSDKDWQQFSPETQGSFQLSYWLIDPQYYIEESDQGELPSVKLMQSVHNYLTEQQKNLIQQHSTFKLLALHPWQARHLQQKAFYQSLLAQKSLFDFGQLGEPYAATTSVRTVASSALSMMLKLSLSVSITNSVRINLPKECRRGLYASKIWHSELGQRIRANYPHFDVINDPAWMGLVIDGEIVNESIAIVRHYPFQNSDNVSNLATLCQDHPYDGCNRFSYLFQNIAQQSQATLNQIATTWFKDFLDISLSPMIDIYHRYGMVFEAHQQNSVLQFKNHRPYKFWVRDNQSFGYVIDYAQTLIEQYPELHEQAHCVVPTDFANSRFIYYFIGNTVFSLISAIAKTQYATEDELIEILAKEMNHCLQKYPQSELLNSLASDDVLCYKGNLLTRLYQLDELIAPVETQSIYVEIHNPIKKYIHSEA
ncbi:MULTISPECIES: IucA/IucC family protein [unclassified Acinetobacter]|uniref:IucA/IucC family protein n=1 Tax=unclassified Acinetobacter TaxID=196816 RepID=UPI0035B6BDE3